METLLRHLVERFLLPPAGPLWLGLLGAVLLAFPRRRRLGVQLLLVSVTVLFALSTPLVAGWLSSTVDRVEPLDLDDLPRADAVVVLGAGYRNQGLEWGGDVVSAAGFDRLRYGAEISRRTGRPILVTGYTAETMVQAMQRELSTPARWTETQSYTTWENAAFSSPILLTEGVRRIYLVTHYWHMPRSILAFQDQGLEIVPAPMGFSGPGYDRGFFDPIIPSAGALSLSYTVYHEWFGIAWYRLRYGSLAAHRDDR